MNEKLEELKKRIREHFDNEMGLLVDVTKLIPELSVDEREELGAAIFSHPHAKSMLSISGDDLETMKAKVLNSDVEEKE